MKHLYNVLEPLAADEDSKSIFKCFIDVDFDSQVLKDNKVLACNLESPNVEFRMNEHTFQQNISVDKQFVHKLTISD